jgi:hypothetical protein
MVSKAVFQCHAQPSYSSADDTLARQYVESGTSSSCALVNIVLHVGGRQLAALFHRAIGLKVCTIRHHEHVWSPTRRLSRHSENKSDVR